MNKTPICLFVYNRPDETRQVLDSLIACNGASEHELYIFSDAARNHQDQDLVRNVRAIAQAMSGFKAIHLVESSTNRGLAKSIIQGVSQVIDQYGRIIVLEDDLLFSRDFLEYMEEALDLYEKDERIWSLSGYGPNISIPESYAHEIYLTTRASSWGWATWKNRWQDIDWDVLDYSKFSKNRALVQQFDKGGNDMSRLLALQQKGRINSWAIRWCYAQFKQGKFTVYPVKSKVINQGFGKNASHPGWNDARHHVSLNDTKVELVEGIQLDRTVLSAFKQHQDLSFVSKLGYFIRLHGLGYKKIQKLFKALIKR